MELIIAQICYNIIHICINTSIKMVPEAGIEPARGKTSTDFKSVASTNSATRAGD